MNWSIFISKILIHVGIISIFITFFFFTIVHRFEKKIIEKQINFVLNDFIDNSFKPVSFEIKNKIKTQLNDAFSKTDFKKQDQDIKDKNTIIVKKAWTFVGIIVCIIVIIILIFKFIFKWEPFYLKFLFNSSIVTLIFIIITQTCFTFLISQNYLSADPNKIKLNILKTLSNNRCDPNNPNSDKEPCIGSIKN